MAFERGDEPRARRKTASQFEWHRLAICVGRFLSNGLAVRGHLKLFRRNRVDTNTFGWVGLGRYLVRDDVALCAPDVYWNINDLA